MCLQSDSLSENVVATFMKIYFSGLGCETFLQTLNLPVCRCLEVTKNYNMQNSLFPFSLQEKGGNLVILDGQIAASK